MDDERDALAGLVVVEVSSTLPSAHVGQFLADFGAEVIHVEPPGGNPLRAEPAFPFWDRGKKSIELDLRHPTDQQVAAGLAMQADVLVESFRPGVAARLGLGYDDLRGPNPALVYASITGFPGGGPDAHLPGYEALVMARIGGFHAFAPATARPGPSFASVPYCAFSAAQTALHGILAALYERQRSGVGQRVETSLLQAVAALDPWNWMLHVITSRFPDAFTSGTVFSDDGTPNTPFAYMLLVALTADGKWLQFSQVQPHLFRALMRSIDMEWMFDDPKWGPGIPLYENPSQRVELWRNGCCRRCSCTLADWQQVFDRDHDVWAEVFRHGSDLLDHAQMIHDHQVVTIDDPERGPVRQPGPIFRLQETPGRADRPASPQPARRRVAHPGGHIQLPSRAVGSTGPIRPGGPARQCRPGGPARRARAPCRRPRPRPEPARRCRPEGPAQRCRPEGPARRCHRRGARTFYAGPFGATVLTDLGARVIKAEVIQGDPTRTMLPFPEAGGARVLQGKESVALDLATDDGRSIVYELVRGADAVLQTFRAGVATRHGVDAASLRAINPNLVYVNAQGYGVDGPCGDRPAYAPTIGAGAGVARRNAGDTVPERADMGIEEIKQASIRMMATNNVAFAQTDGLSALGVGTALLLGLVATARRPGGRTVSASMLSTVAHSLSEDMVRYEGRPATVQADRELHGYGPLYRLYPAASGWVSWLLPRKKSGAD